MAPITYGQVVQFMSETNSGQTVDPNLADVFGYLSPDALANIRNSKTYGMIITIVNNSNNALRWGGIFFNSGEIFSTNFNSPDDVSPTGVLLPGHTWFVMVSESENQNRLSGELWLQTGHADGDSFTDTDSAVRLGFLRGSGVADGMSASYITGDDSWQYSHLSWLYRYNRPVDMHPIYIRDSSNGQFEMSMTLNSAIETPNLITFIGDLTAPQPVVCQFDPIKSVCTGWYGIEGDECLAITNACWEEDADHCWCWFKY